jgi:type I restriction enzyme S subunit
MSWKRKLGNDWGRLGMMSEWRTIRAADFIDFNPRLNLKKGAITTKVAMDKLKPFTKKIPETEKAEFNGGAKFCNGDTVMARITPCLENGKTAYVDMLDDGEIGFGSTEFIVMRAKAGISDPQFVYYTAINPTFRNVAIKSMVGSSGRQRVQQSVLEELELSVPGLDEQRRIGAFLAELDEKIALNNKINDNLEQQAQALYKAWFVDLIPYNRVMPSDWFNGTVDDLAKEIICGKTPSTKIPEYYGGDIPFITIPDMHGKIYTISTERCLSTYGANTQAKKTLPKNAICVSCIGTAGLVTLVASKSQTNQQINSIIPKDNFSPYYIYLLMQTLSEVINKLGQGGSTIVNLSKAQFGKIKVCIPSVATMRGFDEIVAPLFTMILKNQKEIIRLSSLRDTLLPKLMSGELDVSAVQL